MTATPPDPTPGPTPDPAPAPAPAPTPTPDPKPDDKGYPPNTPISEMNDSQRAAYFEEKSRVEENRRKDVLRLTGGKYGDDLKADMEELARLREEKMSDSEKAVETAKTQVRTEVAREMAADNVRTAFTLLLPDDMPEDQRTEALEVLNLEAFLTPDGKVDTAKVRTHATKLAPAKDTGTTRLPREFGQGKRGPGQQSSGLDAGAELYKERHKKSTTS
jgi:hypothetical protein